MVCLSMPVKLAACFLGAALSASASDDAAVLVQSAVQAHQQAASSAGVDRVKLVASLASGQMPTATPFDCEKAPKLCEEPFNCQTFNPAEIMAETIAKRGLAANGEANLKLWCAAPMYQDYVHTCLVKKDLVAAAQIQYEWSLTQKIGMTNVGIDEVDASYCFLEGHCTNTAVTNETTLEDSYKMCDDRYGHLGWTKFGSLSFARDDVPDVMQAMPKAIPQIATGFHQPAITKLFLKAACAMGNYHCDVVYCKETYCKKPYYINKYKHLEPKAPGHLLQSRDFLNY